MTFMSSYLRRVDRSAAASAHVGLDDRHRRTATDTEPAASSIPAELKAGGSTLYRWSFVIHKWTGLFAAIWLAVLGLTGFFLDHDSWRWQFQSKVPSWLTTKALEQNSNRSVVRLLQIDPSDRSIRLAGGQRGLWFSRDAGESWQATAFPNGDHPQTFAIEPDPALGWKRLWLATDDGVYLSEDAGANTRLASLRGEYITSLAAGAAPGEMIGVIDKSRVFRFKTDDPAKITYLEITPPSADARPREIQLNRFLRELHFGKGIFDPLSSLVMNDIGGIGMFVLSITGLLYWGLPKWWKFQAKRQTKVKMSKTAKKTTILWLFRLHSVTLGIASVLMLIYLSVTGIFIGHGRELGEWMRTTRIPQAYLTPIFGMPSWKGWIDAIVASPGQSNAFTIGSRIGLFASVDSGQTWALEKGADGKPIRSAGRLRRLDDKILIPNGMAGPSVIRGVDLVNHEVAAGGDHSKHVGMGEERRRGRRQDGENSSNGAAASTDHSQHMGMGGTMRLENGQGGEENAAGGAAIETPRQTRRGGGSMAAMDDIGGMAGMFMPTDVTRMGDKFAWKNSDKLLITDANGNETETLDIKQPNDPGVPWFNWFLRLHMGTIFWSEWKWVNDVFAISAVLLSATGLIRWWRKKWA